MQLLHLVCGALLFSFPCLSVAQVPTPTIKLLDYLHFSDDDSLLVTGAGEYQAFDFGHNFEFDSEETERVDSEETYGFDTKQWWMTQDHLYYVAAKFNDGKLKLLNKFNIKGIGYQWDVGYPLGWFYQAENYFSFLIIPRDDPTKLLQFEDGAEGWNIVNKVHLPVSYFTTWLRIDANYPLGNISRIYVLSKDVIAECLFFEMA